jgi:hypothetical protein
MVLIPGLFGEKAQPTITLAQRRAFEEERKEKERQQQETVFNLRPPTAEETHVAQQSSLLTEVNQFFQFAQQERALSDQAAEEVFQMDRQQAQQQESQQTQMLVDSMKPAHPRDNILQQVAQIAASRGLDLNGFELYDRAREQEGQYRLAQFSSDMERMSPEEQSLLGPMAAGLAKEGMSPDDFKHIVDVANQPGFDIYEIPAADRRTANRILQTTQGSTGEPPMSIYIEEGERPDPDQIDAWRRDIDAQVSGFLPLIRVQTPNLSDGEALQLAYTQLSNQDPDFAAKLAAVARFDSAQQREEAAQTREQRGVFADVPVLGNIEKAIGPEIGEEAFAEGKLLGGLREVAEAPLEIGRELFRPRKPPIIDLAQALGDIVTGDVGGAVAELKEAGRGIAAPIRDVGGEALEAAKGEQMVFAPLTRPLFREALESVGLPESWAENVAEILAEIAVPSTLLGAPVLRGIKRAPQLMELFVREGLINTVQFYAGAQERGDESPPAWQGAIAFVTAGGARVGLETVPGIVRRIARKYGGAERAEEVARLGRAVEEVRVPVAREGEVIRFHGTTDIGAGAIRSTRTVQPTTATTGTLPGVYLHTTEDLAQVSAKTAARIAGQAEETVSVFRRADLNMASPDVVADVQRTLGLADTAGDMQRLVDELQTQGYHGAEGVGVAKADIIFDSANVRVSQAVPTAPIQEPAIAAPTRPIGEAPARAEPRAVPLERKQIRKGDLVEFTTPKGETARGTVRGGAPGRPGSRIVEIPGRKKPVIKKLNELTLVREEAAPSARPGGVAPEEFQRLQAEAERRLPSGRLFKTRPKSGADTVERLNSIIRSAPRLKRAQRSIAHDILQEQVAKAARLAEIAAKAEGRKPGGVLAGLSKGLKGKRALPVIEPPRGHFTDEELLSLEDVLRDTYRQRPLDMKNALEALDELMDGLPPPPSRQALLLHAFGSDFAKAMSKGKITTFWTKIGRDALKVFNLQRVLLSGAGDLSAIGRQAITAIAFPKQYIPFVGRTARIFLDEDFTAAYATRAVDDPMYKVALESGEGLKIRALEEAAGRGPGEELIEEQLFIRGKRSFLDDLHDALPGPAKAIVRTVSDPVRRTARSYSVGLASLRFDIWKTHRPLMMAAGYNSDEIGGMTNFVNRMTGRGTLGPGEAHAPVINQMMFAARLAASRVQAPFYLFHDVPYVRKMAARSFIGTAGVITSLLGMMKAAGYDVEHDPRSADWGKVRIGPTRVDLTGGYGPLIRFVTRVGAAVAQAPGVKTDIDDFVDLDVKQAVASFLEGKMSPGLSSLYDIFVTGENFAGERLTRDWTTVRREIIARTTPFFLQALVEVIEEGGWEDAHLALPELIGTGVQSYTPPSRLILDVINNDIERGHIALTRPDGTPRYDHLPFGAPRTRGELLPLDRHDFELRHAEVIKQIEEQYALRRQTPESQAFDSLKEAREVLTDQIQQAADLINPANPETFVDFKETFRSIRTQMLGQSVVRNSIFTILGLEEDQRPDVPGLAQDIFDYYAVFDRFPNATADPRERERMFDALDDFTSRLGPTREAELLSNLSPDLQDISAVKQYTDDSRTIRRAGWWDLRDQSWAEVRERRPNLPDSAEDYELELRQQLTANLTEHYGHIDPVILEGMIEPYLRSDTLLKFYQERLSLRKEIWLRQNSDMIGILDRWGWRDVGQLGLEILTGSSSDLPLGGLGGLGGLGTLD